MTISDEAVEAAAVAIWQVRPLTRENIRAATRRALVAAEAHRLEPGWDDAPLDPRDYDKARL